MCFPPKGYRISLSGMLGNYTQCVVTVMLTHEALLDARLSLRSIALFLSPEENRECGAQLNDE